MSIDVQCNQFRFKAYRSSIPASFKYGLNDEDYLKLKEIGFKSQNCVTTKGLMRLEMCSGYAIVRDLREGEL